MVPSNTIPLGVSEEYQQINLRVYPEIKEVPDRTITVGDMHANTMKLLWLLIKNGVVDLDKTTFDGMWRIYDRLWESHVGKKYDQKEADNIRRDLEEFQRLLNNIKIKQPHCDVRLLGDVFADRGASDYLTLKLFKRLREEGGGRIEVMFSNHDVGMLRNYKKHITVEDGHKDVEIPDSWRSDYAIDSESGWEFFDCGEQQNSMVGLYVYIKLGLIKQEEVVGLVDEEIVPAIKFISYSLSADRNSIDIFMHAPNNFRVIKELAESLGLQCNPRSATELAEIIDNINRGLLWLQQHKEETYKHIVAVADRFVSKMEKFTAQEQQIGSLLGDLIWNRQDEYVDFTDYPDFVGHVVHGHDGAGKTYSPNQVNLDDLLGKTPDSCQGNWHIFFTVKQPSISPAISQQEGELTPCVPTLVAPPAIVEEEEQLFSVQPEEERPLFDGDETLSSRVAPPPIEDHILKENELHFQELHPDIKRIICSVKPITKTEGYGLDATVSSIKEKIKRWIRRKAPLSSTKAIIDAINQAYLSANWRALTYELKILKFDDEQTLHAMLAIKNAKESRGDIAAAPALSMKSIMDRVKPSPEGQTRSSGCVDKTAKSPPCSGDRSGEKPEELEPEIVVVDKENVGPASPPL